MIVSILDTINHQESERNLFLKKTYGEVLYLKLRAIIARERLQYGEDLGYNKRSTCKARNPWWKLRLGTQMEQQIGFNYNINDTGRSFISLKHPTYFSDSFHVIRHQNLKILHGYMNSTLFHFLINVNARVVFGGGKAKLQTFELQALQCLYDLSILSNKSFIQAYESLCKRKTALITEEVQIKERQIIDNQVFDALNLTQGERDAVYEATTRIVKERLNKARSLH
jgi:hypothetical protein